VSLRLSLSFSFPILSIREPTPFPSVERWLTPLQRQSHPRRQPQLAHAAGTPLLNLHARHRRRHLRRSAVRHEPEKLPRGIRHRLHGHLGLVHGVRHLRVRVGPHEAAPRAARQHVGRPRRQEDAEEALARLGGSAGAEGPGRRRARAGGCQGQRGPRAGHCEGQGAEAACGGVGGRGG